MMKNSFSATLCAGLVLFCIGCQPKKITYPRVNVTNQLALDRSNETVEINLSSLHFEPLEKMPKNFVVREVATKTEITSQAIDNDLDGIPDMLIFQPKIPANGEKEFMIIPSEKEQQPDSLVACYSRFVPERTDDYAWENNKVAFRTYGPSAQQMIEDSIAGGTLSSGIDAWLKRVEYPIINKWYKKETETDGTYHEDNGEGLDNFHVGVSRGVGGIAVKKGDAYYVSKNFAIWKTLYNGPLQTSFVLTYADWDAGGKTILEEKHITLDYGSNLSKFEVDIAGTDTVSVGLTLHENDGTSAVELDANRYLAHWEPHGDSELGMAIIVPTSQAIIGAEKYVTNKKDESNLYVHLKSENGNIVYYAGFGWKKSGQFTTLKEWKAYLKDFALKLNNPLQIVLD